MWVSWCAHTNPIQERRRMTNGARTRVQTHSNQSRICRRDQKRVIVRSDWRIWVPQDRAEMVKETRGRFAEGLARFRDTRESSFEDLAICCLARCGNIPDNCRTDDQELWRRILNLSQSEAKKLGIGKSTLHYLRKNAESDRSFRIQARVRGRLEACL